MHVQKTLFNDSQHLLVQRDANILEVCIDFSIMSGVFSSAKSFPSLSQLALSLGNAVDLHLPICLSVASFHGRGEREREREKGWKEAVEGNEQESKQAMGNSVFGGYGREGLAGPSNPKPVGLVWRRKDSLREILLSG